MILSGGMNTPLERSISPRHCGHQTSESHNVDSRFNFAWKLPQELLIHMSYESTIRAMLVQDMVKSSRSNHKPQKWYIGFRACTNLRSSQVLWTRQPTPISYSWHWCKRNFKTARKCAQQRKGLTILGKQSQFQGCWERKATDPGFNVTTK